MTHLLFHILPAFRDNASVATNNSYTFNDVRQNHTISVTFKPDGTLHNLYSGTNNSYIRITSSNVAAARFTDTAAIRALGVFCALTMDIT